VIRIYLPSKRQQQSSVTTTIQWQAAREVIRSSRDPLKIFGSRWYLC